MKTYDSLVICFTELPVSINIQIFFSYVDHVSLRNEVLIEGNDKLTNGKVTLV